MTASFASENPAKVVQNEEQRCWLAAFSITEYVRRGKPEGINPEYWELLGFTKQSDIDQVFVDTKFEFGYVTDKAGNDKLIYMDEVGTPDSSRIWDGPALREGKVVENSKEGFRQLLLEHFPEPDILLNKGRMDERFALAKDNALPADMLMQVSDTYVSIAEKITGSALTVSDNPRAEILDVLGSEYGLVE